VPLGRYENPNICSEVLLKAASEALSTSKIKQTDFIDVLNYATNSDDFIYFDPPYYPVSETSYFTAYSTILVGFWGKGEGERGKKKPLTFTL
jgi:DNA adenine methylase